MNVKQGLLSSVDGTLAFDCGGVLIIGQGYMGGSIYIVKYNALQLVGGNDWLGEGTMSGYTLTITPNPYGLRYFFIGTNNSK